MKRVFFLLLFFYTSLGFSQTSIKGKVLDKGESKPLINATVILLTAQDSILKAFTRTNEEGNFTLQSIEKGSYLVLITYPKFELHSENITVADTKIDLKDIRINSRANVLEEVVITQKLPIKIKGDTIEYNAASFETEKNAKLEDLLRRLPGLTVSADGAITAQGKTVSKVLIDGEEFFGYDPKIAIRNVRADAVDKVQVYEKKSDEAELTGVDDGVRIKTVNVVLKEEARKGIFGNANANIGTKGLFDASLFAAKFNKTERIGLTGNWNNMGGSNDSRIRSNSSISGNPEYKNIGINYDNNFLQKRLTLNSSYNFNNNSLSNERKNYNKQLLPDKTQETTSSNFSNADTKNQNFRTQIKFRIDSVQQLDVQFNADKSNGKNSNTSERSTTNNDTTLMNTFKENSSSSSNNDNADLRLNYRRRLNNKGRSINVQFNTQLSQNESTSLVKSTTDYYKKGALDSTALIDQKRLNNNSSNRIGASFNFNERLLKDLSLAIGYKFSSSTSKNLTNSLNANSLGEYNSLDSLYSQDEENNNINNGANIQLNYNIEDKLMINISNVVTYKSQKLIDRYRDINLSRNFWDNNINASLNYRISLNKNVMVSYSNANNIPSFSQLQPIQPVKNPLFIQLGNPNLKKSTNNAYEVSFNSFSILRGSSFNVNGSFSSTNNPIVNRRVIDSLGVTTSSYENIKDHSNWSARIYSGYSKPIFNNILQFNPSANFGYSNSFDFINGELNNSKNYNADIGFGINKQNSKNIDFNFSTSIGVNRQETLLKPELNSNSLTANINTDIKYFLPFKFDLVQVINYGYTGKNKFYPKAINQFYMNLELNKKLMSNNLQLSLKAFDIFNTFNTVSRSSDTSSFSETMQKMLTQYFMLGLKWDFNKKLGKKND
ncbi:TonB-dependent receptor [Sphingobacterium sp. SRCM116780]|uniref:TonB-dependent receptor domain-containing protein n=1 Tax=Sphingobacterium sp. SRCM116780 TaxID=2907623 RepID=UPI001F34E33D|nr:TonB-dependent receptor [Sphingobacterium sp. SRCM116780]UIR56148.1 TonB-dependent receptor [Sphingobacterium sp. SRCM116780]